MYADNEVGLGFFYDFYSFDEIAFFKIRAFARERTGGFPGQHGFYARGFKIFGQRFCGKKIEFAF